MLGVGRIGGVAGALVGAALMGMGWQFGSVFGLLAVPALIAALGLYVMTKRAMREEPTQDEAGATVAAFCSRDGRQPGPAVPANRPIVRRPALLRGALT